MDTFQGIPSGVMLASFAPGSLPSSFSFEVVQTFSVVVEQDEDGAFIASVPTLPGCHTQARSLDELRTRIAEAIALHLEEEGPPRTRFVGIQQVEVEA